MESSLFDCVPRIQFLRSPALLNSFTAASKLIRSDVYQSSLIEMFDSAPFNRSQLSALIKTSKIEVDMMKSFEVLDGRISCIENSKIFISPVFLVECKDNECEAFHSKGKRKRCSNAVEKCSLLLVVVLIHEFTNFVMVKLCSKNERVKLIRQYKQNRSQDGKITNYCTIFGHMAEKELFGYIIRYSVKPVNPSPFEVDQFLGCDREGVTSGIVLVPTDHLCDLLRGCDVIITADMLKWSECEVFHGQLVTQNCPSFCRFLSKLSDGNEDSLFKYCRV